MLNNIVIHDVDECVKELLTKFVDNIKLGGIVNNPEEIKYNLILWKNGQV